MSYRTNDPLGGDLSGTVASATVSKINGVTITGTPASTYTLQATSSTAASWQAGGSGFTAGGDLSGTSTSQQVVSITGATGVINIASTGNIITWNTATTAPGIKQANNTTNSAVGALLTIQAQNATGTTATGGGLTLTSGTGTTAAGATILATGGTTRLTANASGVITIANLGTGIVHADGSGNLTSSLIVNADVSATAAIAVASLAAGTANQVLINNATPTPAWTTLSKDVTNALGVMSVVSITGASGAVPIAATGNVLTWAAATTAPGLAQTSTSSATQGANLTITPQQSTQATNNGGGNVVVALQVPIGTGTEAYLTVNRGAVVQAQLGALVAFPSDGALYLGSNLTPSNTNYAIVSGTAGTAINAVAGAAVSFNIGGLGTWFLVNTTNTTLATPTLNWTSVVTTPTITQTVVASGSTASATGATGATMAVTSQAGQSETGTTSTGGNGGVLTLSSGAGGTGTNTNGVAGTVKLQVGGTTTISYIPTIGTHNSQTNRVDSVFGNAETAASATPTSILTYTTTTTTGGLLTISLVSRCTVAGTGIAVGDTATATYVLAFKNVAGTVTLSTAGITLVGAVQTTAAALTSILTASVATNVITILVTNPAVSTVDSEVQASILVN